MVQIFVSYSHKDKAYLAKGSLIDYLKKRLKGKAVFWWDEAIETGDHWNDKIRNHILDSQIAVTLISPNFLKSDYIKNTEIKLFTTATIKKFIVFPIIISSCDFRKITWLEKTQYIPGESQSIENDYSDETARKKLYKEIGDTLLKKVNDIKKPVVGAMQALGATINIINSIEGDLLSPGNRRYLKKRAHSLLFEGSADLLTAAYDGDIKTIITFKDLKKKLKPPEYKIIMNHHKKLNKYYSIWLALNPKRFNKATGKEVKSTAVKQRAAILEMVNSLIEILGYLNTIGFDLHDHYIQIYNMLKLTQKTRAMNSK